VNKKYPSIFHSSEIPTFLSLSKSFINNYIIVSHFLIKINWNKYNIYLITYNTSTVNVETLNIKYKYNNY